MRECDLDLTLRCAAMRDIWFYSGASILMGCLIYAVPAPSPRTPSIEETDPVYHLKERLVGQVVFDACPDAGRLPLGTILCGGTYTIWYETRASAWHALGPNKEFLASDPTAPDHHSASRGTPPAEGEFVIWGLKFSFSETGVVSFGGEKVGHLQIKIGNMIYRAKSRATSGAGG
jgi:hypothetical protein